MSTTETKAQVPWVWTLDSLIADLTRQQYSHRENKAKKRTKKKTITTTLSLDRPIADEKQGMEEAQPHHRNYRREHPGKIP